MITLAALLQIVVWLIVVGLIFWLLFWLISFVGLPEPFAKIAKVILALVAVIICISFLMSLAGAPLIKMS